MLFHWYKPISPSGNLGSCQRPLFLTLSFCFIFVDAIFKVLIFQAMNGRFSSHLTIVFIFKSIIPNKDLISNHSFFVRDSLDFSKSRWMIIIWIMQIFTENLLTKTYRSVSFFNFLVYQLIFQVIWSIFFWIFILLVHVSSSLLCILIAFC